MNAVDATPHEELIAELMNPNNPKNDREHAAVREIERLRETLEQPEQESLEYWNAVEGWVKIAEVREHFGAVGCGTIYKTAGEDRVPVYTTPPQRQWVGLTPEEVLDLFDINNVYGSKWIEFARTVEAKLKEKNSA